MNECRINKKTGKIEISQWYRGGVMMVRRDALPADHEESFYSCLARLGLRPEDYGYYRYCPICSRRQNE